MLVGRSGELERLDGLVAAALSGRGQRLYLSGDPGMGRTALLDTIHRRAERRGVHVLHLRAADGQGALAGSLVEDLVRAAGDGWPGAADLGGSSHDRVLGLLVWLCQSGPTLLLVDDAHLADGVSLDILRTAIERLGQVHLSAIVSSAPDPASDRRFQRWPGARLEPLHRDAARAVLRASLGPGHTSPIPDDVVGALHGNPCALVSAVDLLSAEHLAGRVPLPVPMPVPATLVAGWAVILDRLTGPTRDTLLDVAVVAGRLDLLTALAETPQSLAAALDESLLSGVLVVDREGAAAFRSPTARDVVVARAPAAQRREAHRRAARAAQQLALSPGIVVDHLIRSASTADDVTAAELAAQAARAEGAEHYAVAARAWTAAARLTTTPSARVSSALSAIQVSYDIGLPVSRTLLEIVSCGSLGARTDARIDPRTGAQIAGIRAEQRSDLDPDSALPAILAEVARAERDAPDQMPTLLLDATLVAWQLGDPQAGLRTAQRYAELDQPSGLGPADPHRPDPPWTRIGVLAAALFQAGDVRRAMPLRTAAIAAAAATDPRETDLPTLLCIVGLDEILLDISPEATDRLLVAVERAGEDSGLLPWLYVVQGWRAKARGDWRTARTLLDAGRPRAEAAGLVQHWMGMTALSVELAAMCGDDEVLRRDSRLLREVSSGCGNRLRLATLDRALGLRALVDGRLGDAIALLSAAADVRFLGRGLRDAVLPARVDLIEALVRSGDLVSAAERYAELHGLLADMDDALATALDERAAALVTGGEEAEAHFRAALVAHECAGEPFEEARTLLLLGEHLRRERRRTAARAALQRAVHAFDLLGAAPWSARGVQELRAAGGLAATDVAVAPLTPQERAIARAVVSGMSNREVAEALFLSRRTVEYHLGNVYRKLEVHGRGALARALDSTPATVPEARD